MSGQRSSRLEQVFQEAVELPPDRRAAFLEESCDGDAALRAEVERLLSHHDRGLGGFLETAAAPGVVLRQESAALSAAPTIDRIGPYHVLRLIGEGGMGAVYEARQDHPRRTVAIKLIRAGLATPALLRRFEYEANILGQLQHPGIAHIYEAGAADTPFGRQPFFAMELIRGRPLTEHVAAARLDLRARLHLFVRACDAVQYAHQKGVIHRDLKPGNMLVDESGQPKILDFGIARATEPGEDVTAVYTETGQIVGTLAYMSPEQISGDSRRVDTRSDVYSLGVILYELLSGRLPNDVRRSTLVEAARKIQLDEPTRLGAIDPRLRGDLETIVAKALDKDRDRRYASAGELGGDIRRFLADEPVLARPASAIYQIVKMARRHRPVVYGALATLAALMLGLLGTTYGYFRAERQRAIAVNAQQAAETAAARAGAINDFLLEKMLAAPDPWANAREIKVVDLIDRAADEITTAFKDQPLIRAALQDTLGLTYLRLGLPDQAEPHLVAALAVRREMLGDAHADTLASQFNIGRLHMSRDQFADAGRVLQSLYDARRQSLGAEHPDTLKVQSELAASFYRAGDFPKAETAHRAVHDARERVYGPDHELTLRSRVAWAWTLMRQGRLDEAQEHFESARRRAADRYGDKHVLHVEVLSGLANLAADRGRHNEAIALYRQAHELSAAIFGEEHPESVVSLASMANVMRNNGQDAEAEPICRRAVDIYRRRLGPDHQWTLTASNILGTTLARLGRFDEAREILADTLERRRRVLGPRHPDTAQSCEALGLFYSRTDRHDEAVKHYREALDILRAGFGTTHPDVMNVLANLASGLVQLQRHAEAEKILRELLAAEEKIFGESHYYYQDDLQHLVECLLALNQLDEAGREARRLLNLRQQHARAPWTVSRAQGILAAVLAAQGQCDDALSPARDAARSLADIPERARPAARAMLERTIAECLRAGRAEAARELQALIDAPPAP